jgi:asparagine synthase (glutamine-hydrolysing)
VATRNGRLQDQAVRSDADAIEALDVVLGRAVKGQMMSDVPLGAFLSGGVDSSAIVAQMCKVSTSPVRTFSIGFDDPAYSEAVHAKAIARHLGTRHTELYVTAADALDVIAKLPALYDEPFSDSSQIPTYLVSTMARRDVTVALSGDGGDELFAGYSRYRIAKDVWSILAALPMPLRRTVAKLIRVVSPPTWSTATRWPSKLLPSRMRLSNVGDKLHKFADTVLVARDLAEMYSALVSHWEDPASIVVGANGTSALTPWSSLPSEMRDPVDQMCLADQLSYLPDDILTKVDRAAMGVGLETRVPLLDHRVVEFAWTVPMHQKIRNGQTKWLLRQVLYKSVPHHLIERPKQGFSVPLDRWLRGPLRDWAESLLSADRLRQEGYINPSLVRQRWDEHQSGVRNWQHHLWDVLMFQAWREAVEVPA